MMRRDPVLISTVTGHAAGKGDEPLVHLHPRRRERHSRGVEVMVSTAAVPAAPPTAGPILGSIPSAFASGSKFATGETSDSIPQLSVELSGKPFQTAGDTFGDLVVDRIDRHLHDQLCRNVPLQQKGAQSGVDGVAVDRGDEPGADGTGDGDRSGRGVDRHRGALRAGGGIRCRDDEAHRLSSGRGSAGAETVIGVEGTAVRFSFCGQGA